jgi:SCP-2 sterol transfer family protein/SnoaL-like protein
VAETVQQFFQSLPARVPAENTAGMTNSYLFEIKQVGTWLVDVRDGTITVNEGEGEADVRLAMSEAVFQKLVTGEQNPVRAVMTGKIKVKGSRAAAAKLQKILGGASDGDGPAPPSKETFQRALEARSSSTLGPDDKALLGQLLADDVDWHGAEDGGGDLQGKEQVIASWNGSANDLRVDVTDVFTDGLHTVALANVAGSGSGTVRQAIVFHLEEDGKVTQIWGLPSDRAAAATLASGGSPVEHPNLPVFLAAEEARARSEFGPDDMALIKRFFSDSPTWHMGGKTGWAQDKEGIDQVIGTFQGLKKATGETLALEILEVFADDAHALSVVRLTADRPERPDKHMDVKEINLFHLDDEGRAYEFWGIPADEAERDAFWMD